MVENSPLDVFAWIRRLGHDFKDSIAPYSVSCIFPYHRLRVDEPFFVLLPTFGFLLGMYSALMK